MKKINNRLIYAAIISTALLCSSCGNQNDNTANNNTDATTEDLTDNSTSNEQSDNSQQSNGIYNPDSITIDTQTIEDNDSAEDGTSIYVRSYVQPTVIIEGNAGASEKINSDLQSRIDSFTADDTLRKEAKEYYNISLTDADYYFNEYSETLDFEAMRSDTNVISFITTIYSYAGGAHGNYGRFGINYDARTGELIDFSEISDDADKFRSDTLAYNKELASTDEYKDRLFAEDYFEEGDMESVLYADEKWYLSDEGLVFISNPYELGPYSSGVIEFVIPYDKLGEMGFKEEYR